MRGSSLLRRGFAGAIIGASVLLSACDPVAFISNQSLRFVEKKLVPPMLKDTDYIMACQSGVATAPLIMATENLGADANQLGTLLYTTGTLWFHGVGVCSYALLWFVIENVIPIV